MADYRDVVIEELADSEALLLELLDDVKAERDAYRLTTRQAIHLCHAQHVELERLRVNHRRVISELRTLRQYPTVRRLEVA